MCSSMMSVKKYIIYGAILAFVSLASMFLYAYQLSGYTSNLNSWIHSDEYHDELKSLDAIVMNIDINNPAEYYILLHTTHDTKTLPHHTILTYSLQNKNVLYHCHSVNAGLGNDLLAYWWSRAMAFFFNLEYHAIDNVSNIKNLDTSRFIRSILTKYMTLDRCKFDDKRWTTAHTERLTHFLPKRSTYTFNQFLLVDIFAKNNITNTPELIQKYEKYYKIQQYLLHVMLSTKHYTIHTGKYDGDLLYEIEKMRNDSVRMFWNIRYPWYDAKWSILYLNDIFRKYVMLPETQAAFDYVYKLGMMDFNTTEIKNIFKNKNDIVIHVRCGDIIRSKRGYSSFQGMSFYENGFDIIKQRSKVKRVGNVYIMIQLLDDNDLYYKINQFKDHQLDDFVKCRVLADDMMEYMTQKNINVYLISNGSMHTDYYRLMVAPNVICGCSTFCHSATLNNIYANTIVWPKNIFSGFDFMPQNIVLVKNTFITSSKLVRANYSAQQLADWIRKH
eukprot:417844_1